LLSAHWPTTNLPLLFRTKILQENDAKDRERLALKFIKVMRCLRKQNNFNSYLALLSAMDSASVRRLDWPKSVTDVIADFSSIIDFSGSFKVYREALSKATPPLIPYMGLVLQDLTFVHIGNSDQVKGKVNFAKRWQQYNILVRESRSLSLLTVVFPRTIFAASAGSTTRSRVGRRSWRPLETSTP